MLRIRWSSSVTFINYSTILTAEILRKEVSFVLDNVSGAKFHGIGLLQYHLTLEESNLH